jgi:hypothetical protein
VDWSWCQDLAPLLPSPSPSFPLLLPLTTTLDPSICVALLSQHVTGGSPNFNLSSDFHFDSEKPAPLARLLRFVLPATQLDEPFWVPLLARDDDVRNPPPYKYVTLRRFPRSYAEVQAAAREACALKEREETSRPEV